MARPPARGARCVMSVVVVSLSVVRRSMSAALAVTGASHPPRRVSIEASMACSALPNSPRRVEAPNSFWFAVTDNWRRSLDREASADGPAIHVERCRGFPSPSSSDRHTPPVKLNAIRELPVGGHRELVQSRAQSRAAAGRVHVTNVEHLVRRTARCTIRSSPAATSHRTGVARTPRPSCPREVRGADTDGQCVQRTRGSRRASREGATPGRHREHARRELEASTLPVIPVASRCPMSGFALPPVADQQRSGDVQVRTPADQVHARQVGHRGA